MPTQVVTLAIVQSRRTSDLRDNLARMTRHLEGLGAADVVLLAENWLADHLVSWQEYLDSVTALSNLLPPQTLLVGGAQYVRAPEVVSRGAFLRAGTVVARYEKLFPSQAVGERGVFTPGVEVPVVEHGGVRLAAVVCVDLFYPEVVRRLALAGALLVLNPASIPYSRVSLWQALGRVRAAENTIFVAMACNTGTHYPDGRAVSGGSFVAYPDGRPVYPLGPEEGIFRVSLDLGLIAQVRERWPYLEDVRTVRTKELLCSADTR